MSETIFDNPYLEEIARQEKLIRYCWETARDYSHLAHLNRERAHKALGQIEAAKVRALQHSLREIGQELCADHADSEDDNFGLVPSSDAHYFYELRFWPRITYLNPWTPVWEHELTILCSQHLPENPNCKVLWHEEFEAPQSILWQDWYIKKYQELKLKLDYQNIYSLVVEKDGKWVRAVDGVDMSQMPVTRIYTPQLFESFSLPLPEPKYVNHPRVKDQRLRLFCSTINDPETEINYIDQERWNKLFD